MKIIRRQTVVIIGDHEITIESDSGDVPQSVIVNERHFDAEFIEQIGATVRQLRVRSAADSTSLCADHGYPTYADKESEKEYRSQGCPDCEKAEDPEDWS